MGKKIIRLTESELHEVIKDAVNEAMQEIKGKTLAKVSNSAINSINNIQNKVDRVLYGTNKGLKMVDQNRNVEKADKLMPNAIQSFLRPYKSTKFLFWAYRREGNPIHLIFTVDNIKKLLDNTVILSGEVIFGREQLPGDIIIDFRLTKEGQYKSIVSYKYKGNGYKYLLEPNVNTKELWDDLVNELEEALTARLKRGLQPMNNEQP